MKVKLPVPYIATLIFCMVWGSHDHHMRSSAAGTVIGISAWRCFTTTSLFSLTGMVGGYITRGLSWIIPMLLSFQFWFCHHHYPFIQLIPILPSWIVMIYPGVFGDSWWCSVYHSETWLRIWTHQAFMDVAIDLEQLLYIIPYGSKHFWEGTANPPNDSKLYPSPTSFQKVRLDP